jgi:phage antirepressor YoqD-like protein
MNHWLIRHMQRFFFRKETKLRDIDDEVSIMQKIIDYLKIKDAADFLGVTPNTLRNWEREKKITVYRNPQNAYRLYKQEDLEQLLGNIKPV